MSRSDRLTHFDDSGQARMVDVGAKPESERWARAGANVLMSQDAFDRVQAGDLEKGDLRSVSEIAGVLAAKKTAELIPLCHPLPLTHISVELDFDEQLPGVRITSTVRTTARTGVEMEAMVAASVAALTVYDMIKGVERTARVTDVRLLEKHGGRSGDIVLESR